MSKADCLNVEAFVPDSNIYQVSFLNLKEMPELLVRRGNVTHEELTALLQDKSLTHGNFYMAEEQVRNLRVVPYEEDVFQEQPSAEPWTVISIFRHLASTRTQMLFRPEYYHEFQGGFNFDNFEPDFTKVGFNAKNLIVGNRKLNIALVAIVEGKITYEHGVVDAVRFYPFKVMKDSKLVYDKLQVYANEQNKRLLSQVAKNISDDLYEIDLTVFPLYEDTRPYLTARTMLQAVDNIDACRSRLKALRYYLNRLKEKMRKHFVMYEEKEWYYGEKIEEEYVSDLGADTLRVYRKGNSNGTPTIETTLNSLGEFGSKLTVILDGITDIADYKPDTFKNHFDVFSKIILTNFQQGVIKREEAVQLMSIFDAYEIGGDYLTRYKEAVDQISQLSTNLNIMNLKLLSMRKDALDTFSVPDRLGFVQLSTKDKATVFTDPQTLLNLVKGKVEIRQHETKINEDENIRDGVLYE